MISVVIDTGHETEIKSETIEELNKKREEGI
jgi:hypothetical protein